MLVLEPNTNIPCQVSQSIEPVKEEGKCNESLYTHLDSSGPRSNCCNHGCSVHVPSGVRSDKVSDAEDVEGTS